MKTLNHKDMSVVVPADWFASEDSTDETVVLVSSDKVYQFTISIHYFVASIGKKEIEESFKKYLSERRTIEKSVTSNKVMLTDYKIVSEEDKIYTKFGGFEKVIDRRFIVLVTAEKEKLFTFYLESIGVNDSQTNTLAADLFNSINIK